MRQALSADQWRRVLVAVAFVQLASALLFAITTDRKVFDERFVEGDVSRYEREGVTIASLRAHRSPPGPGMPILAALGGRAAPGSPVARRIPVFLAWVGAAALLVALTFQRRDDAIVAIAGTVLLAQPHSPLSMATLLSEGPAFACAMAALLLSGLARPAGAAPASAARILLAGCCLGLAVWCRQYYLALVPAFAAGWWRAPDRWRAWTLLAIGPVVAVGALFALWGGLTSPLARAGAVSHAGRLLRAAVAFNPWRPLSALAYVGAYSLPLLPWRDPERLPRRALVEIGAAAFVAAVVVAASGRSVWGGGPTLSVIGASAHLHRALPRIVTFAATFAAFSGVLALGRLAWTWGVRSGQSLSLVAAGGVVFFVLEQLGVDPAVPFYERYAHQVIFFSTVLLLLVAPPPRAGRILAFVAILMLVSQLGLWGKARAPGRAGQPVAAVKCAARRSLIVAASWMGTPCAAPGSTS